MSTTITDGTLFPGADGGDLVYPAGYGPPDFGWVYLSDVRYRIIKSAHVVRSNSNQTFDDWIASANYVLTRYPDDT